MKKLYRVLALALLLALVAGIVPAMAEPLIEPSLIVKKLYASTGSVWLGDLMKDWKHDCISVKSNNPAVLQVNKDNPWAITPKKAGRAKLTVTYMAELGPKKMSAWYTVEKYPKPIKQLLINGKSIKLVNDDRLQYVYWPDDDDKPAEMLIHLTPAKGWKIAGIKAYTYNAYKNSGKHSKLTVRDNVKFTVKVDYEAVITYTLKKGSSKFVYTVSVLRAGE